ncbi:6-N-hydroxylaminopurine resistance protein [Caulifigura coniformis]|uniref:6-N-hydroxylaminopurine resistance protein n=1 Tax=Caulifigura coniformis TaxID=2527983 RepID=A0A517SAS6_9PLAN|nr:MOSC domain-containing protein [Caulifigura coniformis]QDT53230.1 6-N-hydroxylaminopurine resistance protein [Caulifigura coniformis]
MPTVVSIQTGVTETYGEYDAVDPLDRRWTTAFFKTPVDGPVVVGWLGLAGDSQADVQNHGGRDKAVLAYSADHYSDWRNDPALEKASGGGFGENLTIQGLAEDSVCIGDVWRVGEALLEVTQPRQPCWKLGRRWRKPELVKQVVMNGRTGWYLRVLEEATIEAGLSMTLERRPHPDWTIAAANAVMYGKRVPEERIRELVSLPELSEAWKNQLGERIMG